MPNSTPLHRAFPKLTAVLSELRHADGHLLDVIKNNDSTKDQHTNASAAVFAREADLIKYLRAAGYQE